MRYAGFWIRFWAYCIDSIIYILLCALFGLLVGLWSLITHTEVGWPSPPPVYSVLSWLVWWFYYALFVSGAWQATPGKRLMGLRVTDLMGRRVSFARATGRLFSQIISVIIFFIGYIMIGLTEKKQGLHDMMAGTFVLYGKAGETDFNNSSARNFSDADTTIIDTPLTSSSDRWVMAGFDTGGHVIRLSFSHGNPKLNQDGLIIGRDAQSCDLHINDQSISRQHARLIKRNNQIWVEDLNSSNGIAIDGRSISSGDSAMLPMQGEITLGGIELSIRRH